MLLSVRAVSDSSEHGNEDLGSIQSGEFVDYSSAY